MAAFWRCPTEPDLPEDGHRVAAGRALQLHNSAPCPILPRAAAAGDQCPAAPVSQRARGHGPLKVTSLLIPNAPSSDLKHRSENLRSRSRLPLHTGQTRKATRPALGSFIVTAGSGHIWGLAILSGSWSQVREILWILSIRSDNCIKLNTLILVYI